MPEVDNFADPTALTPRNQDPTEVDLIARARRPFKEFTEAQLTALEGVAPAGATAGASDGTREKYVFTSTSRVPLVPFVNVKWFGAKGNGTADDTVAIQDAIDAVEAAGGGIVFFPRGTYKLSTALNLKTKVALYGSGPFATIIQQTGTGVKGLQASSALSGITLRDFQLKGTGVTNVSEDGLSIVGDASTGFPKFKVSNLLITGWGNRGAYLENIFDATLEDVNFSSNKSHGAHLVAFFGGDVRKALYYQNDGHGLYCQSAAGSTFTGDAQENKKNGALFETAQGCDIAMYLEQNGWSTATDSEKAQLLLTQRSGGYAVSSGNDVRVYALGGKGSTGPTMESTYGVYVNFGSRNRVSGTFGGHLTSDVYLTSNSVNNILGDVQHLTGLTGGDTPTPVTNNGTMNGYSILSTVKNERIETLSFASQSSARSITFAKAFSAAPKIVGTAVNTVSTTDHTVKIANVTATGFDFVVTDGSSLVSGIQVNFIAVGA